MGIHVVDLHTATWSNMTIYLTNGNFKVDVKLFVRVVLVTEWNLNDKVRF
jgi:hypothetical protein